LLLYFVSVYSVFLCITTSTDNDCVLQDEHVSEEDSVILT